MANFFEKLKKGIGIETPKEKEVEISVKKNEKNLPETEGELAVDVWQTQDELVVQAPIAGVKPEDLNITLEDDVLVIEGERKKPLEEEEGDYFLQECYWGKFSRKIILPVEIDSGKVKANFKDGILTIRLPKIQKEKKKKIVIKAE